MGREIVLFKSEEKTTAANAAAILREIADKVESGTIKLSTGDSQLELAIPANVTLKIKAEEEEGRKLKRSLEVELEWVEGEEGGAPGGVSIG